jgi:hypothetical protein
MRQYNAIHALMRGERIIVDGWELEMESGPIQSGDFYVGQRNQGPKFLTCDRIRYTQNDGTMGDTPDTGTLYGIVYPVEMAYPYDEPECVKVRVLNI